MDNRKFQSEIQCSQFEALLAEALEGRLPEEIQPAFETHSKACLVCGPMFAEAHEGMEWLRALEEVEPPKNLVHNILAATTMAAASELQRAKALGGGAGWLQSLWNSIRPIASGVAHPRFVTSFAMAFFSLSLTLSLAGVRIKDLAHLDLRPASVSKAVVLQFTQVEARVVRYYENMRFVYEIQSRVRELRKAASSPDTDQNPKEQQQQPKQDKNRDNDTSGRPENHDDYSWELNDSVIAYAKSRNEGANL